MSFRRLSALFYLIGLLDHEAVVQGYSHSRCRLVTLPFSHQHHRTHMASASHVSRYQSASLEDEEDDRGRRGKNRRRENDEDAYYYYENNEPARDYQRRTREQTLDEDNADDDDTDDFYDEVYRKVYGKKSRRADTNDWGDDDEDDDEDNDEEEYDLLGNVLIPNPLLDSMDPDGAADRFPELARDPRFWFDMVLFIAFLNFLSSVGPQDPFPDIPWFR